MDTIFYDGHCGLCHRSVRFVALRDPRGERFQFAPLHGQLFNRLISKQDALGLPDSFAVLKEDGTRLTKSAAVLHVLFRLDGCWRTLARLFNWIPRPVRDTTYDGIARIRSKLFARPKHTCPALPSELRSRFHN
jgi:predicted DCC family thiol-disulfide oxidoreductase YuxK